MIDKKQKNKASKPLDQSYWGIVKRKFRKNIPARISLILIAFIVFVGVFAPMLANDRPIMAKTTDGEVHWPAIASFKASWQETFGGKSPCDKSEACGDSLSVCKDPNTCDWKQLRADGKLERQIWPLIPYSPNEADQLNVQYKSPKCSEQILGEHADEDKNNPKAWKCHTAGTNLRGEDMMSRLIHGCRIAVLVGVISMGIASIIGILVGAIAGYFGDNRLKVKRIALLLSIPFVILLLFALFLWLPTFYHQKLNPDRYSSLAELPGGLASLLRIVLIAYTFFIVFLIPNIWYWMRNGRPFKVFRHIPSLQAFFTDENHGSKRFWWALNIIFLLVLAPWLASYFQYDVNAESCIKTPSQDGLWANFGNICQLSSMMGKLKLLTTGLVIFLLFQIPTKLGGLIAARFDREHWVNGEVNIPVDLWISRVIEVFISIPRLLLILAAVAVYQSEDGGGGILLVMAVIGFTTWTRIARFMRGELLRVRNLEFIEAAQALGFKNFRIILRHALPNALTSVLIAIAFGVASAILIESSLSFLGIGVEAETATWGKMLADSRAHPEGWWLAVFPGVAIFLTVTMFNLLGEGLASALDPKSR